MSVIRVFVVNAVPVVLLGLRAILESSRGFEVIGEVRGGLSVIPVVCSAQPDVVIIELGARRSAGLEMLQAMVTALPRVRIIVLSDTAQSAVVREVMAAGATGYVTKAISSFDLVNTVQQASGGYRVFSPDVMKDLAAEPKSAPLHPRLTQREKEILALVAAGHNNQSIADLVLINLHTVKFHMRNILHKLRANNRTEAALVAIKHQLVD